MVDYTRDTTRAPQHIKDLFGQGSQPTPDELKQMQEWVEEDEARPFKEGLAAFAMVSKLARENAGPLVRSWLRDGRPVT